jgi:hypothetical protein
MHVLTFRSRVRPEITGVTPWRTGANVPEDFRPRVLAGQRALHVGDPVTGIYRGADTVLAGINRDGFYIARTDVRAHP